MPRDIPVSNGNLLLAFDREYNLREVIFPYVGEENHSDGEPFRLGFWVNGNFSWVGRDWKKELGYMDSTMVTEVRLENENMGIKVLANDLVDFHENIYLKRLLVKNTDKTRAEVRVFFHHDFHLYGNKMGDTAAYKPDIKALLHYKLERYFLANVYINGKIGFDQYATGNKEIENEEGTWRDAEDGILSNNPIAQGSVDSVGCIHFSIEPGKSIIIYYWICAGRNWNEVSMLNKVISERGPESIFKRTSDYWKLWVNKENICFKELPAKIEDLYKKSLIIIRTQIDNRGGIIAANDSDNKPFNRDTYSYVWHRDGALVAYALDDAGYFGLSRSFFEFCLRTIERDGYFFHKYTPNGAVGSSWHPWFKGGEKQLPIQEDETALVIAALWNHFKKYKDIEFIKPLYKPLIKNAAEFMCRYRDDKTGLPLESYDLWEERRGILTYTVSAVHMGLIASANFTEAFGETELADRFKKTASEIKSGMDKYLYLEKEKRFSRMINILKDGSIVSDKTVDASMYAIFYFVVYSPEDEKVKNTMKSIEERLWCKGNIGGIARYENDTYHRVSDRFTGNPWFICTLWIAQYYIAAAKDRKDLKKALELINWCSERSFESGVMAEQVHPLTGEAISVAPLTWSHATFVKTVLEYISKLNVMEK